jgi:hypothetical protein
VPSQLSDCLNAGTGCQWCVPILKKLHAQWENGETPEMSDTPEEYAAARKQYHRDTGRRPPGG